MGSSFPRVARLASAAISLVLCISLLPPPAATAQSNDVTDPAPIPEQDEVPAERDEREEIVAERSENAKTFAEPDGSTTLEVYPAPIHVRNEQGVWKEIDNSIVTSDEPGHAFENKRGKFTLLFPASADGEIEVRKPSGKGLSFSLFGGRKSSSPQIDDDTIVYPNVFPGIDLEFQARGSQLKEYLILKQRPDLPQGELRFTFPLRGIGLSAVQNADNSIDLVDADGDAALSIPQPWMEDSSENPVSGDAARSDDITMEVMDGPGGQSIEVTVDTNWILDPERVYPIKIDPIIVDPPVKDTYVANNVSSSQSGSNELKTGTWDGGTTKARALIKWNLPSIPVNANVSEAKIKLHQFHSSSCQSTFLMAHRITSDWSAGVTWSNKPSYAGGVSGFTTDVAAHNCSNGSNPITIDIRTLYENWRSGTYPNYGVVIKADNELDSATWRKFHSAENSFPPKLHINYNTPPEKPISPNPPSGGSIRSDVQHIDLRYHDQDELDGGYMYLELKNQATGQTIHGGAQSEFCTPTPNQPGVANCGWDDIYGSSPGNVLSLAPGTYQYRAYAWDHNATSPWSDWYTITITSSPPQTPANFSPATGTNSTNRTPTLAATYRDHEFDKTSGYVDFEIYENGSLKGSGRGNLSSHGGTSSWQSGSLQEGHSYSWRARAFDGTDYSPWGGWISYSVQAQPPSAPTISSPTHPDSSWSTNDDPAFTFTSVDDSGIAGYSYDLVPVGTTGEVDFTIEPTGNTAQYSNVQENDYLFRARAKDNAGNWGLQSTYPVKIDPTPAGVTNLQSSTHPSETIWYANDDPRFTWTASDVSGITGYSCDLNQDPDFDLDQFADSNCNASGTSFANKDDGTWYFHVRARNGSELWGSVARRTVLIDQDGPVIDTLYSDTHPDPNSAYLEDDPRFYFSAADLSGVEGFRCSLDAAQGATPTTDCTSPHSYSDVGEGIFYFHVQARNGAGAWGPVAEFKVQIEGDGFAPSVSSTSHPDSSAWYSDDHPYLSWLVTTPPTTGVAGYRYSFDVDPDGDPGEGTISPETAADYPEWPDGVSYFHIKAKSNGGTWSQTTDFPVRIDTKDPEPPTLVHSTTHQRYVGFRAQKIEMTWTAAADLPVGGEGDASGLAGYRYQFVQGSSGEQPPADSDPNWQLLDDPQATTVDSGTDDLVKDVYWFHMRAVDKAGNESTIKSYGPMVVDPQGSPIPLTPTLNDTLVAQSDTNGLEQFYPYRSFDLGTHTGYVNLHSGNLVAQGTDVRIPGKGLNAVLRHAYNSHRTHGSYHDNGLGRGWTLSLADADTGLDATGAILDIDLNTPVVPTSGEVVGAASGTLGGILELTDGDGTVHRFIRPGGPGTRWDSPPGVSLRVRENLDPNDPTGSITQSYDLIRPDGVIYRVGNVQPDGGLTTDTWHVTSISDRNGNELALNYGGGYSDLPVKAISKVRVTSIDHNRSGRMVELRYSSAGLLEEITALPGTAAARRTTFSYQDGRLASVTENAELAPGDQRLTSFDYEMFPRNELDPLDDVHLLTGVTDGLGNKTDFSYDDASATGENRLTGICDRRDGSDGTCDAPWKVTYGAPDPNSGERTTGFTTPLGSTTSYLISGRRAASGSDPRITGGNILRITDAGSPDPVVNDYQWEENRLTSKTDGAGATTLMSYNDLGLLTKLDAPTRNVERGTLPPGASTARVETIFVYDPDVSNGDAEQTRYSYEPDKCSEPTPSGGAIGEDMYCDAVAVLVRSSEADNHSGQRRLTDFVYDGRGNLTDVIGRAAHDVSLPEDESGAHSVQPAQQDDRATKMTYTDFGTVATVDGPRADVSDVTTYSDHDPSGLPRTITDATGKSMSFTYSPYGLVTASTDRAGRTSTMSYDQRDNLVRSEDPDGDAATLSYDLNDNVISGTSPRGTETATAGDFTTTSVYDPNEWLKRTESPGSSASEVIVATSTYNADGTVASTEGPVPGAVTTFSYHPNQLVEKVTAPGAGGTDGDAVTSFTYDAAGRQETVKSPRVNGSARPTRSFIYAPAGTVASVTESSAVPDDRITTYAYDPFGAAVQVLGPRRISGIDQEQLSSFDAFGQTTELRRRVNADKWLSYGYAFDEAGNQVSATHPTGNGGSLTATYVYDRLGRLIEQSDPQNPGHRTEFAYLPEGQQEVRRDYKGTDLLRAVKATYSPDYSVDTVVATDHSVAGTPTVASCNFPDGAPGQGYDPNGNLLITRSVKGSSGCDAGDVIRTESFTYDGRDLIDSLTQKVQAPGKAKVTRAQSFTYREDGARKTSTWDGRTTTYGYTKAGYLSSVADWRAGSAASSFTHFPAGGPAGASLGGGIATADFSYHRDGSPSALTWQRPGAAGQVTVRAHTAISYDLGGQRTSEQVEIEPAGAGLDTGGQASFNYDLAGRLTSWTSPFRLSDDVSGTDAPTTTYSLDDGGNITTEETRAGGAVRKAATATYVNSRLEERMAESFGLIGPGLDSTTTTTFTYNGLGEETARDTDIATTGVPVPQSADTASSYDPAGRTAKVEHTGDQAPADVEYLYDATGQLIARTASGTTTYFFYSGSGISLAEETRPSGATEVRYLSGPSGRQLAEQRYPEDLGGEPDQSSPTWVWLLADADGNVATELKETATGAQVMGQRAYDPYGALEDGGSSKVPGEKHSTLGYQDAHTDEDTGRLLIGPRIYDPTTDRFTTADFFVGARSDLTLGTDPLTGNRYLFAAANPVAFDDDGHCPRPDVCGADYRAPRKTQMRQEDLAAQSVASWTFGPQTIPDSETIYVDGQQYRPGGAGRLLSLGLSIAGELTGASDAWRCIRGDGPSCAMLGIAFGPGKFIKGLRLADEAGRAIGSPAKAVSVAGRTPSTRRGQLIKSLTRSPDEWELFSAHAEPATGRIYRGGLSLEEIFVRGDDWIVRHRIYDSAGEMAHQTFRPYAKFGAP